METLVGPKKWTKKIYKKLVKTMAAQVSGESCVFASRSMHESPLRLLVTDTPFSQLESPAHTQMKSVK